MQQGCDSLLRYVLGADEIAEITLAISTGDPGGFRLRQSDPETDPTSAFLTGSLQISRTSTQVPDSGSMAWMLCAGFGGLIVSRHKRAPKNS